MFQREGANVGSRPRHAAPRNATQRDATLFNSRRRNHRPPGDYSTYQRPHSDACLPLPSPTHPSILGLSSLRSPPGCRMPTNSFAMDLISSASPPAIFHTATSEAAEGVRKWGGGKSGGLGDRSPPSGVQGEGLGAKPPKAKTK